MSLVSSASPSRTRLHAEGDLRVLWLSAGRSELALSVEGLWLRRGRRETELCWQDIQQIQAVPTAGFRRRGVRVQIFGKDGGVQSVGPFSRAPAERWLQACAEAAAEHGERPLPLHGATGFALSV